MDNQFKIYNLKKPITCIINFVFYMILNYIDLLNKGKHKAM